MKKNVLVDNLSEKELIELILKEYNSAKSIQFKEIEFMKSKKFNYGDVVIKKSHNNLDNIFGINTSDVGVIVGCYELDGIQHDKVLGFSTDNKRNASNMYRVRYDDYNSYIGEYVEDIELYSGEIPEHLKNIVVNGVYFLGFNK